MNTNNLTLMQTNEINRMEQAVSAPEQAISRVCQCVCQCVCNCLSEFEEQASSAKSGLARFKKIIALYATMVVVSTCAIFWLEHASIFSAFRTALVAAIGKTFAANWVSSLFE